MKRLAVLIAFVASAAAAQDFELGMRHLVVNTGSTGELDIASSRGFAATAELFVTPRFSTELSASFTNPEAMAGDVDLGTLGLQTTALTARYHLGPVFVGAGGALVTIGNLDDQSGEEIDVQFDRELAPVVEAGLRLHLRRIPRLAGILTVIYMPLTAEPDVRRTNVALPEEVALDPLTVGFGASWRF